MPSTAAVTVPDGGFKRIAVLRLSSLGDVVLTLPVVHALAAAFPKARLDYWTKEEFQDAIRHDPAVTHVRALERDARRLEDLVSMSAELEDCDLIVDLHGNSRTRLLTMRQSAPVLRAPSYRLQRSRLVHARWSRPAPVPRAARRYAMALNPIGLKAGHVPCLHVDDAAERWADMWLDTWNPGAPPVAFCPAARHATKRWPEAHWTELHRRVRDTGQPVVWFSLAAERDAMPALRDAVAGDAGTRWCTESLPRMAAMLSRCCRAVTCDSGLMHVAAARGRPVVALFGSTAPELGFAPSGEGHSVLCRHEPCQPCTIHGRPDCPKGHFNCMVRLKPETVFRALDL